MPDAAWRYSDRAELAFQILGGCVGLATVYAGWAVIAHHIAPSALATGAVVGFGLPLFRRRQDTAFRSLPAARRAEVRRGIRHGTPTGDLDADQILYYRLRTRAQTSARANRITYAIIMLAAVGLPVAAAVMRHQPWWVAASLPALASLVLAGRSAWVDPQTVLARFEAEAGIDVS